MLSTRLDTFQWGTIYSLGCLWGCGGGFWSREADRRAEQLGKWPSKVVWPNRIQSGRFVWWLQPYYELTWRYVGLQIILWRSTAMARMVKDDIKTARHGTTFTNLIYQGNSSICGQVNHSGLVQKLSEEN